MRHIILSSLALTTGLLAQSVIVPNSSATTTSANGLNTLLRNAANPRTYQYGVNASQLSGIPVGSVITGISLRLWVSGTTPLSWPTVDTVWNQYDISVGPAAPTATWGANPALNFASPPQVVRSGAMTMDAASFLSTNTPGVPNALSEFYFDFQAPYTYTGGDLAMLFSHPGSTDPVAPPFPEVVVPAAGTHGVSLSQAVYPAGTAMVTANFYVMRIHYGYGTGCPGAASTAPVLVQNGDTNGGLGGNIKLTLANAAPNGIGVFALGFTQLNIPLGSGCNVLASPDVLFLALTNSKGRATLDIPIPPGATGTFFAQGAMLDASPLGLALTNGVSPSAN